VILTNSRHPDYLYYYMDWVKYRLVYDGGIPFVQTYLKKLSSLEKDADFLDRRSIAYCPGFASAEVHRICDAIHERLPDVQRVGGTRSYQTAVVGDVDLQGSSMNTFMGLQVLPELLIQAKVGILVDNHSDLGTTIKDRGDKHPYLTVYAAENILSWAPNNPINGYDVILLQEVIQVTTPDGLPNGNTIRYRYMRKMENGILVIFFDADGNEQSQSILDLKEIPFIILKTAQSLLRDVADYQIALLNVESSDISFIRKANYPLFYEFYDPATENPHLKGPEHVDGQDTTVKVGMSQGRRYPNGISPPNFIGPDPEILRISIEKGKELKNDIKELVNTNVAANNPSGSRSLEAGLSAIGQVLQTGETQVCKYWAMFEGSTDPYNIAYPTIYSIKTDEERLDEVLKLDKIADRVPSDTYKRAVRKRMAKTILGNVLLAKDFTSIENEIDNADVVSSDPNIILSAQAVGLIDDVTAANALGFDGETVVPKAKLDRAERIKLTMEAQGNEDGAARGSPEMDKGQPTSSQEKSQKKERGKADNTNMGGGQ
jgi:hypothetical protein